MDVVREAGVFGLVSVFGFVAGLVVTLSAGRARGAPMATATPFILGILAVGQIGQGIGQRMVREALHRVPQLENKVAILNEGTAEAAASLVISGACACVLCALAGAVEMVDRRP